MLIKISKASRKSMLIIIATAAFFAVLISSVALANEGGEDNEFMDTSGIDTELDAPPSGGGGFFKNLFGAADSQDQSNVSADAPEPEIRIQENDSQGGLTNGAVIRLIDKTLGKLYELEIPVGSKKTVNEMTVKVNKCWKPEGKKIIPEGKALIEIFETRNRVAERLFNGWMYAQSPSASQLSHHKYDVTLGYCTQTTAAQKEEKPETHEHSEKSDKLIEEKTSLDR